jgi:hypothetical protein
MITAIEAYENTQKAIKRVHSDIIAISSLIDDESQRGKTKIIYHVPSLLNISILISILSDNKYTVSIDYDKNDITISWKPLTK